VEWLRRHPFAVDAHFAHSVVLAFAVPAEQLRRRLPPGLELDTFADRWGFLAVAMVDTRRLRPAGFPSWAGRDFSLIGYRIFVRFRDQRGRSLRGLFILRSETDRAAMAFFGNLFTRYNYRITDVAWKGDVEAQEGLAITSEKSDLLVQVRTRGGELELPPASPFADWREARKFAGPMPFTFSPNSVGDQMVIIEGQRSNWDPRPLLVDEQRVGFLEREGFSDAALANAFVVSDIPYRWSRGRREPVGGA
jgi:Uncharacterized conserved protein (COG2071)